MTLTNKQKKHLRTLGHDLRPVIQLGKHGMTEAITRAADQALTDHELVKVKCGTECPDPAKQVAEALCSSLKAGLAQVVGKTILMYRPHPNKPTIKLPKDA